MRGGSFLVGVLAAALFGVSGCVPSLTSDEPPTRIYWLEPAPVSSPTATTVALRIEVVPGLEADHIWILQRDQRLNYYAGAHWPDTLRPLLQSVMQRSIGHFGSSPADLTFDILIERFFAVETPAEANPRIELRARISRPDIASPTCAFQASRNSSTGRLRDIVAAHQAVLDQLTNEVNRLASVAASTHPYAC
jgi:ABC-type uncharacterized transport system auxiliary subunit